MFRRALVTAIAVAAITICIALAADAAAPRGGGVSRVPVPDSPSYALDGLNEKVIPAFAYAQAVHENEVRAQLEAELARRARAAQEASHAVRAPRAGGVDWDGIAQCETGSNWSHVGYGDNGARFEGGLGFYHGAWTDFGGRDFAPNANLATREQQIIVAERLYARHGLSGWGCRAYG